MSDAIKNYDWSTFTVRINVKAGPDSLYHAWSTRAGMEHWFLRLSEFKKNDGTLRKTDEYIQKGDTYKWRWHGWPDEVTEVGE